ncbi:hypothetical protein BC628DRAFT_1340976 [Trametes gibbosa]|nr:hypothetical protein BC628DRAFT_1340976 [Trametes gibbosa]
MAHFPWGALNTKTIRTVVHELGLARYVGRVHRKRLEDLMKDIERDGRGSFPLSMRPAPATSRADCVLWGGRCLTLCIGNGVVDAVLQRLQERAEHRASPVLEYAGPPLGATAMRMDVDVEVYPVVEIPSRAGPSRARRGRVPSRTRPGSSVSARGGRVRCDEVDDELEDDVGEDAVPEPAEEEKIEKEKKKKKKGRLPPPSYAVLYQLEQEISEPSLEPIPLLRPDQRFDGVVLTASPRRLVRSRARRVGEEDEEEEEGDDEEGRRWARKLGAPAAWGSGRDGGLGSASARTAPMRLEAVELTSSARRRS